jgi:glycosyltransferase involved in cell wall biosynthesis
MNGEKPLNIAYLSVFYPYRGGIAQFNAALYRALEQLGHVQSAYTFTRQYPDFLFPGSSQFVNEHDSADPIPAKRILDTVNPFNWFSVASEIKAKSPDLLLTQLWMPFMGPAFGTIARRMEDDCIKLCVVHNAIPHESRPGDTAFTKYMLSAQDGLIAISDAVEHDLKSMNIGKPILRKEHPIYTHFGNPVSQYEARERLGLPHDKQIILFFGFIREYKGLMNLIEALKSLPESIWSLPARYTGHSITMMQLLNVWDCNIVFINIYAMFLMMKHHCSFALQMHAYCLMHMPLKVESSQ